MTPKLGCVLLIDDDEGNNYLNQLVLEEAGIAEHIEIALNGQEAIDYLIKAGLEQSSCPKPDLIFLDLNMPLMDGWEFLEAYQQLEAHQRGGVIIVMLTTSMHPDDKERAEQTPEISDFKNKPLTAETLADIMARYFPDRQ